MAPRTYYNTIDTVFPSKLEKIKELVHILFQKAGLCFLDRIIFLKMFVLIEKKLEEIEKLYWKTKIRLSGKQEFFKKLDSIKWAKQPEHKCLVLYELAKQSAEGAIVEIGSLHGKSTLALALGSREGRKNKVFAVDPFKPYDDKPTTQVIYAKNSPDYEEFLKNIERFGMQGIVFPIKKTSEEAAKEWKEQVSLLFIDGNHLLEEVRKDYNNWKQFLLPGAKIVLDDAYSCFPGPLLIAKEIKESKEFKNFSRPKYMAIAEKK